MFALFAWPCCQNIRPQTYSKIHRVGTHTPIMPIPGAVVTAHVYQLQVLGICTHTLYTVGPSQLFSYGMYHKLTQNIVDVSDIIWPGPLVVYVAVTSACISLLDLILQL